MNPIIISQLKYSWLKKRSELSNKRRPRRYLHFDKPITAITKSIADRITNSDFITTHSFFPLINNPQSARIYKKDPITKIKKIEWKERPISYPSHFDSLIYSWYAHIIENSYEERLRRFNLNNSVIAYRKLEKSNVDFAADVFKFVRTQPECVSIALDIKGFYDNLDFKILKNEWKQNFNFKGLPIDHYKVFKSITNFAYVRLREISKLLKLHIKNYKKSTLFFDADILSMLRSTRKIKTNAKKGIPQGTPISCVLSNLYMFNFDKVIFEKIQTIGGLYRRYSDDIIIICPTVRLEELKSFAESEIKKLKLEIQSAKTEVRYFTTINDITSCKNEYGNESKLQYLGIEFDGSETLIRHKSYARFERRMKKAIIRKKISAEKNKTKIFKKQIYESFSPLGKRNYITYAKGAVAKLDGLNPDGISKQIETNRILKKINKKIVE